MSGATTAVAATKGLRGVAQDFLAPELRALTERVQGFENLNRERFAYVDRRFDEVDRRFDAVDKRFDAVDKRLDAIEARLAAMPGEFASIVDRLIAALNVSNRLAAIEQAASLQKTIGS